MAQVLVDESSLSAIADTIREKLDVETTYLPSQMADAIESIQVGTSLTGDDVGKVVASDGGSYVLQSQTSRSIDANGTYDTTENNQVIVNVSGSSGGAFSKLSGFSTPSSSLGNDGDIYFLLMSSTSILHFDTNATANVNPNVTWAASSASVNNNYGAKFGANNLYITSSNGYPTTNDNSVYVGSNDFTIDCWIYVTTNSFGTVFALGRYGVAVISKDGYVGVLLSTNGTSFNVADKSSGMGSIPVENQTWTHVALVRNNDVVRLYVNGTLAKSVTIGAGTSIPQGGWFRIGRRDTGSSEQEIFVGGIDEFRIVNGMAMWTDEFTPPTEAYSTLPAVGKKILGTYARINGSWYNVVGQSIDNVNPSN